MNNNHQDQGQRNAKTLSKLLNAAKVAPPVAEELQSGDRGAYSSRSLGAPPSLR